MNLGLIQASDYIFQCDEANANIWWIADRSTDRRLYSLPLGRACTLGEEEYPIIFGVSSNERWLALGAEDSVTFWDLERGEQLYKLPTGGYELWFSNDSSRLYTRSRRAILVWDVNEILERAGVSEPE